MEQQKWNEVHIGTDVRADRHTHTDQNTFQRSELKVGGIISDHGLDGSDVFSTVTVVAMDDYSLTIQYGKYKYTLTAGQYKRLDSGGRDYASFDLWIALH